MSPRVQAVLSALLCCWGGLLVGAWWLGLAALPEARVLDSEPRLVLRGTAPPAMNEAYLRAALRAADMAADGALWMLNESPLSRSSALLREPVINERVTNEPLTAAPVSEPMIRPGASAWEPMIEIRAEDAGALRRLQQDVRVQRLGGEPVLTLRIPDRGSVSERVMLPILEAKIRRTAQRIGAEIIARRQRRSDEDWRLQWVLAAHPRGEAAPDVTVPPLSAPQLPRLP